MPRIRNNAEREVRVEQVLRMLVDGMSQNAMARELDISPQAVQRFLRTREWGTAHVVRGRLESAESEVLELARSGATAATISKELDIKPVEVVQRVLQEYVWRKRKAEARASDLPAES